LLGKSSFTTRYISNKFLEKIDPTIEDTYIKETSIDGDPVIFEITGN
jgi:GTPase SAR1 family protein